MEETMITILRKLAGKIGDHRRAFTGMDGQPYLPVELPIGRLWRRKHSDYYFAQIVPLRAGRARTRPGPFFCRTSYKVCQFHMSGSLSGSIRPVAERRSRQG